MVYVMISPNYDVNTCQLADMHTLKKEKSGNRRKNFFTGTYRRDLGI